MTWWQKTLQFLGGGAALFALLSYVQGVEHRITSVEEQEKTNTELLMEIKNSVDSIDVIENDIKAIKKKLDI